MSSKLKMKLILHVMLITQNFTVGSNFSESSSQAVEVFNLTQSRDSHTRRDAPHGILVSVPIVRVAWFDETNRENCEMLRLVSTSTSCRALYNSK